ncbi:MULTISPECIES: LytTR family DNA-binding domain-containing protein [Bacteroidota]|uniref:LytTR family DNA-binding domain-containing protein n=1 Tax=Flectobacillus rivi TaxID=2984209 RepID=A0ABT6Z0Q0_9BACT|nr:MULTISPECIES: LytTR family DNA-binding domain-containing protein [Bacteroidota]MDI9874713.1 LytTR family DNA-binding domain-containing protein [Flectobacillus rivi]NBB29396.1 hypothetical protein [Cellulophaga sp. BC115SP]
MNNNCPTHLTIGRKYFYFSQDIMYFEGSINYTFVHLQTGRKDVMAQTIGRVATKTDEGFVRISRKHLVNRQYIRVVHRDYVELLDKSILPIARRRRGNL